MILNTKKDHLFYLVKSLTKAEKRNFKLYANRYQGDATFVQLFDLLNQMGTYDDAAVLKALPSISRRNLPNHKRHLYQQLLKSLRLLYIKRDIEIFIHEQIDFARILYSKGMYMQALRTLESVKNKAEEHHQDVLHLEIIEFQKLIEARHITRSRRVANKMEGLLEEASQRSRIAHSSNLFSNFNIQVQGWYIEYGHVKSEKEVARVHSFFEEQRPKGNPSQQLTFFEKAHLYQAYMWYHYILLDFNHALEYAKKWAALFQADPQMQEKDPTLYIRALYYNMVLHYMLDDAPAHEQCLTELEIFYTASGDWLNAGADSIAQIYLNLSQLNHAFVSRQYRKGIERIPGIKQALSLMEANTDVHRILLFYYKFAYLHFCDGQFEAALDYLNEIIHLKAGSLREDLLHNTRMLHLICHYELGNYRLLDYLIRAVQRLFTKAKDLSPMLDRTLRFLTELTNKPPGEHPQAFRRYHEALQASLDSPFERKAIHYLDVPAWVEGHLDKRIQG